MHMIEDTQMLHRKSPVMSLSVPTSSGPHQAVIDDAMEKNPITLVSIPFGVWSEARARRIGTAGHMTLAMMDMKM